MSIRVLIADDHKIVREGLRSLLEKQPDVEVIAESEDGYGTLRLAREMPLDVIIMDVAMPGLNGIEATRQVMDIAPGMKVLALSMYSDLRFVAEMLNAGASGYLLKDCAFEELVQALRTVFVNQTYLSPSIVGTLVKDYIQRLRKTSSSAFSVLTTREHEVLQLLAEGRSTKEIASQLGVSTKTIETHRQQIMDKLAIRSIAELTKYAIREGLTSLDG